MRTLKICVLSLYFLSVSKILDRVIDTQLRNHLEKNICCFGHSLGLGEKTCTSALIKITGDLLIACNEKLATVMVLLDFSKSIDTVNHRLLQSILHFFREFFNATSTSCIIQKQHVSLSSFNNGSASRFSS